MKMFGLWLKFLCRTQLLALTKLPYDICFWTRFISRAQHDKIELASLVKLRDLYVEYLVALKANRAALKADDDALKLALK